MGLAKRQSLREFQLSIIIAAASVLIAAAGYATFHWLHHPAQATAPVDSGFVPNVFRIPDLLEAELLRVGAQSGPIPLGRQGTKSWASNISGDAHLFAQTQLGDWIEFDFPTSVHGPHRLTAYFTKSGDYGVIRVSINDRVVVPALDLSSTGFGSTGPVLLGTVDLNRKINRLRVEVIDKGKLGHTPFYQFGFDGIQMEPATNGRPVNKVEE